MRNDIQFKLAGVAIGLVLVAVLVYAFRPESAQPVVAGSPAAVKDSGSRAEGTFEEIRRVDAGLPQQAPQSQVVGALKGIVVDSGRARLPFDGVVHAARLGGSGVEVEDGQFSIPVADGAVSIGQLTEVDFLLVESGGVLVRPLSIKLGGDDQSTIELVVADAISVAFRVVDLRGNPVAGARLQVAAPVPMQIDVPMRTDKEGAAVASLRPTEPKFRVRVLKDGYVGQTFEFDSVDSEDPIEVSLQRFIGSAVVVDMRYRMSIGGSVPGDFLPFASAADWRHIANALEDQAKLEPFEQVRWIVVGEDAEWISETTIEVGIRAFDEYVGTVEVPVRHIVDEDFEIQRGAEGLVLPEDAMPSVDITILPRSAFRSEPPEWLGMLFSPLADDVPEFVTHPGGHDPTSKVRRYSTKGRHLGDGVYRYWLPEGVYAPQSDLNEKSNRQATPLFLANQEIRIGAGNTSSTLRLAPDERYVTIELVDPAGFPVDVAAALTIALPENPTFWPARNVGAFRQWVRPGRYSIWGMELHSYETIEIGGFDWPTSVDSDGVLHPVIDYASLGFAASALR